ncbi:class I SAM-dependent DNA methyltransferase [Roseivivax isoporae]|uniref:Methyltransferase type 11 domain-containing protein n=1 Tax=Roseivivax isoporae LMG 25204 TaxID=1449351 RepID=X7F4J4_9RHOB|nr:class I SAM-dependent methyltransferase [Roseivivax isoporae]ETX27842.1 hypothetical protein RISW2_10945 [Roseivivax isoporae LMG 25204]
MSSASRGDREQFDLKTGTTESDAVSGYYDDWAPTYDTTLRSWNYRAPADAAALLAPLLEDGCAVLDVGCGTGFFGSALQRRGTFTIIGADISEESLKIAEQTGSYDRLMAVDLQKLPLPISDNAMDAAASVGVLTYIEDAEALLRDLCRIVRPEGVVSFTQRTDRWEALGFGTVIERMARDGAWTVIEITEPRAYLPENPEFGDDIRVIHTLCRAN